ncbi:MAG: hypothetical protein HN348_00025 [Proteobacteria bacterium]|jgi:uncharacterized secreted protein with C-terminal beta-propeller domain|nr:hypothetical protein [Pseudomonadota bacterium]
MSRMMTLLALALTVGCANNGKNMDLDPFKDCNKFDKYMKNMARREVAWDWGIHHGGFGGIGRNDMMVMESGDMDGASSAPKSVSVSQGATNYSTTNIQEEGIDEDDLMKTDGTYMYAIAGGKLVISQAYPVEDAAELSQSEIDGTPNGIFLVEDHVYVLSNLWWNEEPNPLSGASTNWRDNGGSSLTVLDVSDRSNPKIIRESYFSGTFREARIIDGEIYIVTYEDLIIGEWAESRSDALKTIKETEYEDYQTLRFDNILDGSTWDSWNGPACGCTDTFASKQEGGTYLSTLSALDLSNPLGEIKSTAVVGRADTIYASAKSVYVSYVVQQDTAFTGRRVPQDSVLHKFDVSGDSPQYKATAYVQGVMPDQFAITEKDDVLFVATTDMQAMTSGLTSLEESDGSFHELDHIGGLGPEEALTAARYVGDTAYLVTWEIMLGDPLFSIDISNPENLVLGGELAITGWSDYLHPLGDEHLLAVGMDEDTSGNWHLAVSLFDVSDFEDPQLAHRVLLDAWSSEAQSEHHAFNYFPVTESLTLPSYASEGKSVLEVLSATADGVSEIGRVNLPDTMVDNEYYYCTNVRRSVIMDDMVWAITNSGMVAAELDAPENILATIEYEGIDPCIDTYGGSGWGWNEWGEW